MTKLTLENIYGKYTIEVPDDNMAMQKVVDDLIIPVLLAAGFHPKTIEEYIKGDSV